MPAGARPEVQVRAAVLYVHAHSTSPRNSARSRPPCLRAQGSASAYQRVEIARSLRQRITSAVGSTPGVGN